MQNDSVLKRMTQTLLCLKLLTIDVGLYVVSGSHPKEFPCLCYQLISWNCEVPCTVFCFLFQVPLNIYNSGTQPYSCRFLFPCQNTPALTEEVLINWCISWIRCVGSQANTKMCSTGGSLGPALGTTD